MDSGVAKMSGSDIESKDIVKSSSGDSHAEAAEPWNPTIDNFNKEINEMDDAALLSRFNTLARTLSHISAAQMSEFQFGQENFDLKKILRYITHSNEENGVHAPQTDLLYEDLTVIGKNTSASVIKDVGDTLLFPIGKLVQKIQNKKPVDLSGMPKTRNILHSVSGVAEPGTMTLVLGKPGAGCSTLLKVLAGETQTYLDYEGVLTYSGIDSKDMFAKHKHNLIYNPELDVHFPYLTVEETFKFAVACKTPSVRVDSQSRDTYIENMKNLYEILFGLKHVEKTLVGDDFVRGISGGQRKRVSIAEAMITGGSLYCFDNATRGLDASTALEFVEALRTSTNITNCTSIVTIYQASESIYELFDLVTVLYLGRQIYYGPINEAIDFFHRMGYEKPPRQTSAEFLTAITDPMARTVREGFSNVPQTPDQFVAYWKKSPEYAALKQKINDKKSSHQPEETNKRMKDNFQVIQQKGTGKNSQYTVNYFEQLKWCSWRRARNSWNNKPYTVTLVFASVVQAFVVGSQNFKITDETIGAFSRGGVIFFSLLYFAIMTLAETPTLFADKPILNKQIGYTMYHPSAEFFAKQIVQFPTRLLAITAFAVIIYFLAGLATDAGKFFQYYIVLILSVQATGGLFVMLSSFCPNLQAAMALCGISMVSMIVYASYMIQRPSMYWWFKWFSYCNPVLYGFEAIIAMQFHGFKMPCSPEALIPSGPGYENINTVENQVCGFVGAAASKLLFGGENIVLGNIYLELSFTYVFGHVWRNFGILIGFIVGYSAITALTVEKFNPIEASSDQLLFIKGAVVPKSLIEDILPEAASNFEEDLDLEKGGDLPAGSLETSDEDSIDKIGSDDIFLWKHVDYVVPYEGEQRKLLDDVSGYVLPGTLTALMGESGAGKTTLLNVLSRRTDIGVVSGDMLINGVPADTSFERRTGYVQQQDLHIAQLTVRESLIFSARLRRSDSVPDAEKIDYVDTVLKILHMEEYADSVAGVPGYGLNVEQRKKLSIATELVAKPSLLLFLDEPTSGLDSQSSWAIVQVMKDLAKAGQAILCTIHQPSATLFEEFDRLLLLKKGGQTVYFGDIGKNSRIMLDYFERQGGRKCNNNENPAEYILETIGAGATATTDSDWYQLWSSSPEYNQVNEQIEELIAQKSKDNTEVDKELHSKFANSYFKQFYYVLGRTALQFWRSNEYIMPKFGLTLFSGLLIGFSFWNVKHTIIGMQNVMFACFMSIMVCAPLANQVQGYAIASRELYEVRESKSNTFHWSCLLLSQYLCEIPYAILFGTIYYICWYFPIQLDNEASRAGTWWLTYAIFFQFYYLSLALMVIYPAPDLPTANVLLGLCFAFIVSFCGVTQRPVLMPGFWKFMWRASPFTYFIGSQIGILLHDRPVVCAKEEYNYLNPPQGQTCGQFLSDYFENNTGYVNNPNDTANCAVCQYRVGDEFLASIGVSWGQRWRNIGFFCAYTLFNLFLMCVLFYVFRVKRWNPISGFKSIVSKFQRKSK